MNGQTDRWTEEAREGEGEGERDYSMHGHYCDTFSPGDLIILATPAAKMEDVADYPGESDGSMYPEDNNSELR